MGQWQSSAQIAETGIDNVSNGTHFLEGQIPLPSFNSTDVTSVDVGFQRKVFL